MCNTHIKIHIHNFKAMWCHQKSILVSVSTTTDLRNVIQIFILLPHYLHMSILAVELLYNMK